MSERQNERRRHPRRGVLLDCRIEGTSAHATLRITDLSVGGCYVDSRFPVSIGSKITVRVLADPEVLLPGRVTSAQPGFGFGIEFDELPDATCTQLLALMARATLQMSY
ncbi:MAG: PilZ domain-containing protein [Vicinamibacterales bacterium]